jgi:hypothetical protein
MTFALMLLLSPLALAQDGTSDSTTLPDDPESEPTDGEWDVAMPGDLPAASTADFVCDWSFNGATGTGHHDYSSRDTNAMAYGVQRLWLDDGSTSHKLDLRYPTTISAGTRWHGRVTSASTDLTCSIDVAWDGSAMDYRWCTGTLYGTAVQSMSVYCDEL